VEQNSTGIFFLLKVKARSDYKDDDRKNTLRLQGSSGTAVNQGHRKKAHFYKMKSGVHVGDLFMSLTTPDLVQ
jgi:hypothetical protein